MGIIEGRPASVRADSFWHRRSGALGRDTPGRRHGNRVRPVKALTPGSSSLAGGRLTAYSERVPHEAASGPVGHPRPGRAPAAPAASPGVAPALALLAASAIVVGYWWLGVLRPGGREPGAMVFAATVVLVATALTRGRRGDRRMAGGNVVVVAALVLFGTTVSSLLVDGPVVSHVAGAAGMLFAVVTLGAALVNERWGGPVGGPDAARGRFSPRWPGSGHRG